MEIHPLPVQRTSRKAPKLNNCFATNLSDICDIHTIVSNIRNYKQFCFSVNSRSFAGRLGYREKNLGVNYNPNLDS
jgi:hypothetical protein